MHHPDDGPIPTGEPSDKLVGMPDGQTAEASEKTLLPISPLNLDARKGDILSALAHNSLSSVSTLAELPFSSQERVALMSTIKKMYALL